jgi:hypothetical protein
MSSDIETLCEASRLGDLPKIRDLLDGDTAIVLKKH